MSKLNVAIADDNERMLRLLGEIVTNDEDIIWIVGFRSSRIFLKDKSTKEVIILKYGKNI